MDMATQQTMKRGGLYCVCGGPSGISCTNSTRTPGISMHKFPSKEKKGNEWKSWVQFVRKHRSNFTPTNFSAICSAHFESSCYPLRYSLGIPSPLKPRALYLNPGSVPTIDTVAHGGLPTESARHRRKMIREMLGNKEGTCSSSTLILEESDMEEETTEEQPDEFSDCNFDTSVDDSVLMPDDVLESSFASFENDDDLEVREDYGNTSISLQDRTPPVSCKVCKKRKNNIRLLQRKNKKLERELISCDKQIKALKSEKKTLEKSISVADDEVRDIMMDEDEKSTADEEENYDEVRDPEWCEDAEDMVEENSVEPNSSRDVRVEPGTSSTDEPKFIVFYSMLMSLFSMFCFNCKYGGPSVTMKVHGTMVTVYQKCSHCGETFKWHSQPLVLGRYPAGNILLSFSMLMAGASISKILLVFKHMGLAIYSARAFHQHQAKFLIPAILKHWETCRSNLIGRVKDLQDASWCGDGRFDSMGHSAKYGVYSMLCCDLQKIVHFELLQANETGSSNAMELAGAKRCFAYLKTSGLKIKTFISDRHRGIGKWIRTKEKGTTHYYDIWHIAKSIIKMVLKASKDNTCAILTKWTKAIKTHLYWCATSTKPGFGDLIVAKWKSFLRHVCNKHTDHPEPLYQACAHGELEPRKWMKYCSRPHEKLKSILLKTSVINDVRKMSSEAQTSSLEGFHATLNHWHPKMLSFSWMGTYCRHILACLHFNENVNRQTRKTKEGMSYIKVTYPKYKLGDELVREISVAPTYGYVSDVKSVLFRLPLEDMQKIFTKYKKKVPEPLAAQFENRLGRKDAIERQAKRKQMVTELFPAVDEQEKLLSTQQEQQATKHKRKAPTCKKCKQPMKGHSKSACENQNNSL